MDRNALNKTGITLVVSALVLLLATTGFARPQGKGPSTLGEGSFVEMFDADGDGKVSAGEFNGPFNRFDKDQDGFITEDEAPTGPPRRGKGKGGPDGGGFIQRFDADGDNMVSAEEFPGPAEHFTTLDKDQNGFVSEDEAPTGPPGGKGRKGKGPRGKGPKGLPAT